MTPADYRTVRAAVVDAGYGKEIEWAESVEAPVTAEDFAREAIWVILCGGMKEQIARIIQGRVLAAIEAGRPVRSAFKHDGKSGAIERIWRDRAKWFDAFLATVDDAETVEFCGTLPWIGPRTKWQLAKSLGVDCAKPDVHLDRLARHYKTTAAELCADLAKATADRVATVDIVLWRACNLGIIRSRELT